MSGGIKRFLPNNQYRAAVGANNPSATNPFATIGDLSSGEIEIDVTPIINGSDGRMLFNSDDKVSETADIHYDKSTDRLGIGYGGLGSLGAQLDIKLKGVLNTDKGFEVKDSSGVNRVFEVNGQGTRINQPWNSFIPVFDVNGGAFSIDEYAVRCTKPFQTNHILGGGNVDIMVANQAGGGGYIKMKPWNGAISLSVNKWSEPSTE